jgi:MSHA pilin protein MshA
MKVSIKNNAQGGFTLIELIVVIVILGILAATALPKFASLGGDARLASLNAAKGALNATAAMAHGKWLVNPTITSVAMEDQSVTLTTNGYPDALATTAQAAGLSSGDYTVYTSTSSGTNVPVPSAGSINIVPASIVGTAAAKNCFLTYTASTTAPPTIRLGQDANGNTLATSANCN